MFVVFFDRLNPPRLVIAKDRADADRPSNSVTLDTTAPAIFAIGSISDKELNASNVLIREVESLDELSLVVPEVLQFLGLEDWADWIPGADPLDIIQCAATYGGASWALSITNGSAYTDSQSYQTRTEANDNKTEAAVAEDDFGPFLVAKRGRGGQDMFTTARKPIGLALADTVPRGKNRQWEINTMPVGRYHDVQNVLYQGALDGLDGSVAHAIEKYAKYNPLTLPVLADILNEFQVDFVLIDPRVMNTSLGASRSLV